MGTRNNLHVLMLGNVSAGKSTLVNALLGNSLLPTANEATTAKIFRLHSSENFSDQAVHFTSEEYNFSGRLKREDICVLNRAHSHNTIYLECHFPMIQHYGNSIYFYDTPGPNTAIHESHANIVKKTIGEHPFTHVLCLLDATKLKTEEESNLLINFMHQVLLVHKQISCIFLVNKVDEIDESREASIAEIVTSTCGYLRQQGFDSPIVLPLMAKPAQVFRTLMRGNTLTKKERREAIFYETLLEDRKGVLLHAACLPRQYKESIGKIIADYVKTPSWRTSPCSPYFGPIFEKFSGRLRSKAQRLVSETGIRTLEVLLELEILARGTLSCNTNRKGGLHVSDPNHS